MKELLAKHGKDKDQCMFSILMFLERAQGNWVNKAELSLQKFVYKKRARFVDFAPETICRKARALADLGLIERREVEHTAEYRFAGEVPTQKIRVAIIEEGVFKGFKLV